jgi:threonine aldolase
MPGCCGCGSKEAVFPILPNSVVAALQKAFAFYMWGKSADEHSVIRLVTSWATAEGQVGAFLSRLALP